MRYCEALLERDEDGELGSEDRCGDLADRSLPGAWDVRADEIVGRGPTSQ